MSRAPWSAGSEGQRVFVSTLCCSHRAGNSLIPGRPWVDLPFMSVTEGEAGRGQGAWQVQEPHSPLKMAKIAWMWNRRLGSI